MDKKITPIMGAQKHKNEMTLDYCFLSDSRNIFCSQGSFLFILDI